MMKQFFRKVSSPSNLSRVLHNPRRLELDERLSVEVDSVDVAGQAVQPVVHFETVHLRAVHDGVSPEASAEHAAKLFRLDHR